jgi:nicotinamidase/pyrazinamidase
MVKKILLRILLALGLVIVVLVANYIVFNLTATKISTGSPIPDPPPANTALLVIDIQGGTTGETSALTGLKEQSEALISKVNALAEDMAARDQPVIYIRTEVANPLINVLNNTMARGTKGAELDPRLHLQTGEVVVKRRNDSFIGTGLDGILEDHQVGSLVLVGLDAGHCVKSTAQAALNRGYRVSVIEEAVITNKQEDRETAIGELKDMGVEIVSVE